MSGPLSPPPSPQAWRVTDKAGPDRVKHLYGLVDELNNMETEMIGMKPEDAIKLKEVPLVA